MGNPSLRHSELFFKDFSRKPATFKNLIFKPVLYGISFRLKKIKQVFLRPLF